MFTGSWTFDGKYQRITPYEIVMRELSEEDMISYYRQGTEDEEMYSVYGFEVCLKNNGQFFPYVNVQFLGSIYKDFPAIPTKILLALSSLCNSILGLVYC